MHLNILAMLQQFVKSSALTDTVNWLFYGVNSSWYFQMEFKWMLYSEKNM